MKNPDGFPATERLAWAESMAGALEEIVTVAVRGGSARPG